MENIILIGMPGCGKSTCGVLAAKLMCKRFIDTDLVIQQHEGQRLQQIIDKKGNDYFAKCEEKWVCTVNDCNSIIATGGSVVYSQKAMEHLKSIGKVVYLKISFEDNEAMSEKSIRVMNERYAMLQGVLAFVGNQDL